MELVPLTMNTIDKLIEDLKSQAKHVLKNSGNLILVHNKQEWLHHPVIKFTEKEIDSADEKGFIAMRCGIDCYLARPVLFN